MTHIKVEPVGWSEALEGQSSDVWENALDWPCWGYDDRTLVLKNKDNTNSLRYRVLVRTDIDGQDHEEVTERTLPVGETARIALNNSYARVKVQVTNAAQGADADYQLDYIGMPNGRG